MSSKFHDPKQAKVGDKIIDTYYSNIDRIDSWGIGQITKVLKTRIHIHFPNAKNEFDREIKIYDLTHFRNFTKKYDKRKKEFKNNY